MKYSLEELRESSGYHRLMEYNEIVLFGASKGSESTIKELIEKGKKIKYIFDNDSSKWNLKNFVDIEVTSSDKLFLLDKDIPILITSSFKEEIRPQLFNMGMNNVYYINKPELFMTI